MKTFAFVIGRNKQCSNYNLLGRNIYIHMEV